MFQPTAVATFLMTIVWLGGIGAITPDVVKLFALGLPALAVWHSAGLGLHMDAWTKRNSATAAVLCWA